MEDRPGLQLLVEVVAEVAGGAVLDVRDLRSGILEGLQDGFVHPVAHVAVDALCRELGDAASKYEHSAFLVKNLHILPSFPF